MWSCLIIILNLLGVEQRTHPYLVHGEIKHCSLVRSSDCGLSLWCGTERLRCEKDAVPL